MTGKNSRYTAKEGKDLTIDVRFVDFEEEDAKEDQAEKQDISVFR